MTISGDEVGEVPASEMLLSDVRDMFASKKTDRLTSDEIIEALVKMEERPWPEWFRGNPMTKSAMARLLKRFDIRPKLLRIGATVARGYEIEAFADAFGRYLPAQTVTPLQPAETLGSEGSAGVTDSKVVTGEKPSDPSKNAGCNGVTVRPPKVGLEEDTP